LSDLKRGPAIIDDLHLIWPDGITDNEKAAALVQLEAKGIVAHNRKARAGYGRPLFTLVPASAAPGKRARSRTITMDSLDTINFPFTAIQLSESVNRDPEQLRPAAGAEPVSVAGLDLDHHRDHDRGRRHPRAAGQGTRRGVDAGRSRRPQDDLHRGAAFPGGRSDHAARSAEHGDDRRRRRRRRATLADEMAKRLFIIRAKHSITREWIRMGALKGLITDGNGDTLLDPL
jgi:hypothetical protein